MSVIAMQTEQKLKLIPNINRIIGDTSKLSAFAVYTKYFTDL